MVNRQRRLTSQELRNDGVLVCIDVSATSLQGLHDNVFFILYLEIVHSSYASCNHIRDRIEAFIRPHKITNFARHLSRELWLVGAGIP
jgi:hypothetical protein